MPIWLIDTAKPKNNGDFPIVEAHDVVVDRATDLRLDDYLENLSVGGVSPGVGLYVDDSGLLSLRVASEDTLGGIKIGDYLKKDADDKVSVDIPLASNVRNGLMSYTDWTRLHALPLEPYTHVLAIRYYCKVDTQPSGGEGYYSLRGDINVQLTNYDDTTTGISDLFAYLREKGQITRKVTSLVANGRLRYIESYMGATMTRSLLDVCRLDYDYIDDKFAVYFFRPDVDDDNLSVYTNKFIIPTSMNEELTVGKVIEFSAELSQVVYPAGK